METDLQMRKLSLRRAERLTHEEIKQLEHRKRKQKDRKKEVWPNLKKEPSCVCVKCKLVQNDVRLTIPSSHYCCITV